MRAIITEDYIDNEKVFEIYVYGKGVSSKLRVKNISIDNGIRSFSLEKIPHGKKDCEKIPELKMM